MDPNPFRLWLRTQDFLTQVAEGVVQSTIENFSAEKYKDLRVPVIPLAMQRGLAGQLAELEAAHLEAASIGEQRRRLLDERKQALITACVTGEFDVASASARAGDAALAGVH